MKWGFPSKGVGGHDLYDRDDEGEIGNDDDDDDVGNCDL